ncbi:hypothetical protein [Streptomyces sp. NBC_00009]|uniref:hypothetical protein n=1 Tax=Streptomyces sp. NBC_00009 TaxID=2975620 RepID=UPI003253270B
MTGYAFASWDRTGAAASLTDVDDLQRTTPVRGTLAAFASVNGRPERPVPVHLYGPGDVRALDPRQIVRVYPLPGTPDAETTKFPMVEFDRTDLPWLFTPLAATSGGELRPWLALVCVPARPARLRREPGRPLPVLRVPGTELPDPAHLHLWAHVQTVVGHEQDPRACVSRLLAPRRLLPHTDYVACLVPTFEAGRRAGHNESGGDLAPAWSAGADSDLPVYHSWTFSTGEAGDFETLADRLRCRPIGGAGRRPMDISRPRPQDPGPGPVVQQVESALCSPDLGPRDPWPVDAHSTQWQSALAASLEGVHSDDSDDDPEVAPPLYGRFHALLAKAVPGSAGWLDTLNLDPRWRVAAGLGTSTVQREQEQLMASAWTQLADVRAANRFLDLARLARLVGARLHERHVRPLTTDEFLHLASPLRTRTLLGAVTLASTVHASALPTAMATTTFRRAVRPLGLLSRRVTLVAQQQNGAAVQQPFATTLTKLAATGTGLAVTPRSPDGTVAFAVAPERVVLADRLPAVRAALGVSTITTPAWQVLAGEVIRRAQTRELTTAQLAAVPALQPTPLDAVFRLGTVRELGVPAQFLADTRLTPQGSLIFPSGRTAPTGLLTTSDSTTTTTFKGMWSGPWRPSTEGSSWKGEARGTFGPGGTGPGSWRGVFSGVWDNPTLGRQGGWRLVFTGNWETPDDHGTWQGLAAGGWDDPSDTSDGTFNGIWRSQTAHGTFHGTCPGTWDWDESGVAGIWRADCSGGWERLTDGAPPDGEVWTPEKLGEILAGWQQGGGIPLGSFLGQGSLPGLADRLPAPSVLALTPGDTHGMVVGAHDQVFRPADVAPLPPRDPFPAPAAHAAVTDQIHPHTTVDTVVGSRIEHPAPGDSTAPIQWAPTYPDAMWRPLAGQSTEWMLAGLNKVPPDSAALAVTNPAFVASYMVGLNHEFARELRWREYPTDQRGTYFASFWGTGAEMPPLHQWQTGSPLGTHLTVPADRVVLLLRTALLRRYPGALVYAAPLLPPAPDGAREPDDAHAQHPIFRGGLDPDTAFLGFDLRLGEILGHDWCFVIAEQPTEPRFGLDDPTDQVLASPPPPGLWGRTYVPPAETVPPTDADDWNNLDWSHFFDSRLKFEDARHAPGDRRPNVALGDLVWGDSAAGIARQCFQQPVRVVMPAERLLSPQPPLSALDFVHWTSAGPDRAVGTLHGHQVTLSGPMGTAFDFHDASPAFARPEFTPRLAATGLLEIRGGADHAFTLDFGTVLHDPVFHLGSLRSVLTVTSPPGTAVARLSGDAHFRVTANTVSGPDDTPGPDDSNGSVRLAGAFTTVTFTLVPTFVGGSIVDGVLFQVGGAQADGGGPGP